MTTASSHTKDGIDHPDLIPDYFRGPMVPEGITQMEPVSYPTKSKWKFCLGGTAIQFKNHFRNQCILFFRNEWIS